MGGAVTPQVFPDFDIVDPKVVNGTVIEASAGTCLLYTSDAADE